MPQDMRVSYTIPGWEPASPHINETAGPDENRPVSFNQVLENLTEAVPPSIQSMLGLDTPPPSQFNLAPPPMPDSLNGLSPQQLRGRWAAMMANHSGEPATAGMMLLLQQFQAADDDVAARAALEARS